MKMLIVRIEAALWIAMALSAACLISVLLSGCNSFGSTPGYQEKHPDLLEDTRHFYRDPLWLREFHRCKKGD